MDFKDLPRGRPGTHVESGEAVRALWLAPEYLAQDYWRYNTHKILIGARENGELVGVADNRHLLTVAGSRAGKGTSAIIPNLLAYQGSVLVLDPKGENASRTAERRGRGRGIEGGGMGHDVYVIDPFGIADVHDEYRCAFNPMALLDPDSPEFIDDCDAMADALVVSEAGKENDFWSGSARIVLRGFIAWVAAWSKLTDELRHLGTVRMLLAAPGTEFTDYLKKMGDNPEVAAGVPREAAAFLLSMDTRERANVMSTVHQNISFLASPPVLKMFQGGGRALDFREWKYGGKSVYLCLPALRLHRHARFFRLFVSGILLAVERGSVDRTRPVEPEVPALMILDEMHVLSRMQALETAAGLVAGYGLRIWSIWQDFAQLKSIYEDRWETFLGNASIFQAFGLNDMTTLKYVSERLGSSPTMQVTHSEISTDQAAGGFTGRSKSLQGGPLLSSEEIAYFFSRQARNVLISYPGVDPVFLKRVEYFEHPAFEPYRRKDD